MVCFETKLLYQGDGDCFACTCTTTLSPFPRKDYVYSKQIRFLLLLFPKMFAPGRNSYTSTLHTWCITVRRLWKDRYPFVNNEK